MKLRTKLLLLIGILCIPLAINLGVLSYLVRTVTQSVSGIQDEAVTQQMVALKMRANLRDAEAALYHYQIEGKQIYADQFNDRIEQFANEIETFASLTSSEAQRTWSIELDNALRNARRYGNALINSRTRQEAELATLNELYDDTVDQLVKMRLANPTDINYQRVTNNLLDDLRRTFLAITAYPSTNSPEVQLQFSESAIAFRFHLEQFESILTSSATANWAESLRTNFDAIQALGVELLSNSDQQLHQFAQFADNHTYIGQEIIVEQIQPFAASQLADAQTQLASSLSSALFWSLMISGVAVVAALIGVGGLLGQLSRSLGSLLKGAERLAQGDLSQPVRVASSDEVEQLSQSFNAMMVSLSEKEERLSELLRKMSLVQEEERRLVGLDLHDGLTQILLSANMHLNTLSALTSELLDDETHRLAKAELERGRERLQEAIDEVRWVIAELRPTELEDYNLADGLRYYVHKVAERAKWDVDFSASLRGNTLPTDIETAAFRIVQEALSNIRKHARTDRIRVALTQPNGVLNVSIQDWGQGFELSELQSEYKQLGLLGMQERAMLVGGDLTIRSESTRGTTVELTVPLHEQIAV